MRNQRGRGRGQQGVKFRRMGVDKQDVGQRRDEAVLSLRRGAAIYLTVQQYLYLSILLSWANSSTFILTYGQRGPSKPSHLEITDLIQFVYNRLFRVLTTVLHISHPHTQTHASYAHEVATVNHFGRTVTPYFAFFFMLCHTRPLSRIYVFVLIRTAAVDGAACR